MQWFDWTPEAFRKARDEDKPVVLAIGAAWCHGCRVMDEQTYGDPEVAAMLHRDYVPIRVDSDRRPDINDRYNMGGWPTTAFLTPTAEVLGGTTYVKPDAMKQLLVQLKVGYATHRDRIAGEIARRDAKIAEVKKGVPAGMAQVGMEIFRKTIRGIAGTFDPAHGGFGKAPKFPLVASLRVMLQALHETDGPDFREGVVRTLNAMGDRGMYDSVDGGFFHYVTNDVWTAPRFEKIAEDNAGLIKLYLDASLVTGQTKYRDRALDAIQWARTTLLDPDRGVFYGSQFADEEYYLASTAARAKRPAPEVDRTVTLPASAAMASAFLRASEVTGEESFAGIALRGLDWLLRECVRDDQVAHFHDGAPNLWNLARDRIALGTALLDAFDHAGERRYIEAAEGMTASLTTRFWSAEEGGVMDRVADPADSGDLARPRRGIQENGTAAENLARLWRHGMGDHYRDWAARIITSFPDLLDSYGHVSAEYALATDWLVRPPTEVDPADLKPYVPRRRVRR